MRAQTFTGMGGHHSARSQTEEWLTPPSVIDALGGWRSFDLDPATPIVQPYPTARARFTRLDNGLLKPWFGRVWLNPPYSANEIGKWLARLAEHGIGTTLIFARTETEMFRRHVWDRASALLFLFGRLNFHRPDGSRAPTNAGAPSMLCAYGAIDADTLAFCGIDGKFVPLRLPRGVFIANGCDSWAAIIAEWFRTQPRGPISVDDVYRVFARHPKARGNSHVRAKLRQQLQRGPYRRVARGQYEMVA